MNFLNLVEKTLILPQEYKCDHKHEGSYFTHHLHTAYSIRDGRDSVKDLVKRTSELGYKRFIPTDHASMASIYDTFKESERYGIKGGIGCEFYIVESTEKATQSQPHITVIAQSDEGYKNMLKLSYLSAIKEDEGELEGFKGSYGYKPHITEQSLLHFQKGLIVGSGCRKSIINDHFLKGNNEKALLLLDLFKENIDNFLIELHVANNDVEERLFWILKKYAKENNLKTIIANDSHYCNKGQLIDWNLLNATRGGSSIINNEYEIKNDDFYLKSYEEIFVDTRRCYIKSFLYEALYNFDINFATQFTIDYISILFALYNFNKDITIFDQEVSDLFEGFSYVDEIITFDWYGSWDNRKLPKLHYDEAESVLKKELWKELKRRFDGKPPQEYIDRIKEEFKIAIETDNASYFYLVGCLFLKKCREEGLMLCEGRGSASSLLMSQLLGCARVDPMKYDLIIDRAMNRDRKKLMDIDLDFASSEAPKAKEILFEIMGTNKAIAISNYGYNGVKASIKHVARYLKIPQDVINKVTKSKELNFYNEEDDETKDIEIVKANNDKMMEIFKTHWFIQDLNNNPIIHYTKDGEKRISGDMFYDYVCRIYQSINNLSVHPSGILCFNQPYYELIPITRINDTIISQFDMRILEELNGLKLDVLKILSNDLILRGLNYLKQHNLLVR